jgi:KDO2-lipid IV(A) lauroyltransferase
VPVLRRLRRLLFYAIVRGLARGLERLPRALAVGFMRGLGTVAWGILARERRVALRQIHSAFPGLRAQRRAALARRSFAEFGENLVVSLRGDGRVVVSSEARARLDGALAEGGPLLVLTAHLGAWELLGCYLAREAAPLGVVTANPHNVRLDRWLRARRTARGMRTFDRHREPLGAAHWLRDGHTLAVLADLRSAGVTVLAPWFARLAPTLVGPGRLARRARARILPMGIAREGAVHRVLVAEPVVWQDGDDDRRLAALCNEALEGLIRQAPEQWPWFHDRYGDGPGAGEDGP